MNCVCARVEAVHAGIKNELYCGRQGWGLCNADRCGVWPPAGADGRKQLEEPERKRKTYQYSEFPGEQHARFKATVLQYTQPFLSSRVLVLSSSSPLKEK